jgi:uncharacterized protein YjbI with pentapeptide repeats
LANPEHLAKIKEGVESWARFRQQNPAVKPDLHKARLDKVNLEGANLGGANLSKADLIGANIRVSDLSRADLSGAYLRGADLTYANLGGTNLKAAELGGACLENANLSDADLRSADLRGANLRGAGLQGANLGGANLEKANLSGADLSKANLKLAKLGCGGVGFSFIGDSFDSGANLNGANLTGADLSGADLTAATLINSNLEQANLTACSVFGVSAWNVRLGGAIQSNLVITPRDESPIQVDNLEVAQFIYLLLNNAKIRSVIDTITSKVVLILGRFTPDRKAVLDAIRDELRKRDYLPVLFDFEKPTSKDLTGAISTLANMVRFIIADLTDPSSVPHELATVVPGTVVPVQAIIQQGQREYAMFADLKARYHWVLEPHQYTSKELLIAQLNDRVIDPAEAKAKKLARKN